jgi:uncharacterized SAM-binding protein YcdF (DUF218 family)
MDFIKQLLDPLAALWLGLILATLWLAIRRRWQMALLAALLVLAIGILGNTRLMAGLLATLERPYRQPNLAQMPPADAILMLGGSLRPSAESTLGIDWEETADRAFTVAELARLGKGKALILGGGLPPPNQAVPSESELLRRWFLTWRLPSPAIYPLSPCRTTREEAVKTAALMRLQRWQNLILVTSAWHLRRSEALFQRLGVPVVCVGCDFQGLTTLARPDLITWVPQTGSLRYLGMWLHEQLGYCAYWLRGWV